MYWGRDGVVITLLQLSYRSDLPAALFGIAKSQRGRVMKGVPIITISVALTWFVAGTGPIGTQQTFIGEISDGPCALNVHSRTHSHQEMSESKSIGDNAVKCTIFCVKNLGGQYVLLSKTDSKTDIYRLDDQEKAAKFAGQGVKLVGVLGSNRTIHVTSIELDLQAKPPEP